MLPHFHWKSNRARDRGTGLRPLPWPAPTHVNRNSFFRDSERVRIAAHLALVEVHLGYLAQRCAGRLAGLLTAHLLHGVSSHGTLQVQCIIQNRREQVSEHGSGLNERDSVFLQVRRAFFGSHVNRTRISVTHFCACARVLPSTAILVSPWSAT